MNRKESGVRSQESGAGSMGRGFHHRDTESTKDFSLLLAPCSLLLAPCSLLLAPAFIVLTLLLGPASALASSSSALRDYKAGKYDQALKKYEQLLERQANDPRLHFNAGAAAYRNRQFDEATKQFDEALNTSSDVALQQMAYYNLGNARYNLGEQTPDPSKRSEIWQQALEDFQRSLKLNPQDKDAKFNYDFVKRKLEELKQQQEQKKNQQDNIEPSEAARKAKAAADEAVRRREYAKALAIMEDQLKTDPTTRYYADYIERLKEVNGVKNNPQP